MATRSRRLCLTQDENFSVHFDGGVKTNGSSVGKNNRGGLGVRKAQRKYNRKNVIIPIEEDKKAQQIPKAQISGKKVQVSGGKEAPGDLPEPECVKLFRKYFLDSKKSIADAEDEDKIENFKKSIAADAEDEDEIENYKKAIADAEYEIENLHNHEKCCLKSQEMFWDEGNVSW